MGSNEEMGGAAISVLIVEDDQEARMMLRRMVERRFPQLTIHLAEDGRAGLRLFKEHRPDIVITDINMPEVDGMMMTEEMQSSKHDTKFIVISGYSDRLEAFVGIGVQDYFVKPTDFARLAASLERCIGQVLLERGRSAPRTPGASEG